MSLFLLRVQEETCLGQEGKKKKGGGSRVQLCHLYLQTVVNLYEALPYLHLPLQGDNLPTNGRRLAGFKFRYEDGNKMFRDCGLSVQRGLHVRGPSK